MNILCFSSETVKLSGFAQTSDPEVTSGYIQRSCVSLQGQSLSTNKSNDTTDPKARMLSSADLRHRPVRWNVSDMTESTLRVT